uniref:Biogenesis of lysosome-related organelles complex 1 subunit 1 n=1 Tax=Denticeps clupeoides TaxID=299321 RepID=A0AAY3ZX79_9TELE
MLSRLLKEHQAKQNERKEMQERRRREAIAAATCLTEALVDHLNVGVAQAYVNQRKLDHEVKTLQLQAGQFAKQTAQWINMVECFNQALKEIGDVENWARSIEMDMRTIATAASSQSPGWDAIAIISHCESRLEFSWAEMSRECNYNILCILLRTQQQFCYEHH